MDLIRGRQHRGIRIRARQQLRRFFFTLGKYLRIPDQCLVHGRDALLEGAFADTRLWLAVIEDEPQVVEIHPVVGVAAGNEAKADGSQDIIVRGPGRFFMLGHGSGSSGIGIEALGADLLPVSALFWKA